MAATPVLLAGCGGAGSAERAGELERRVIGGVRGQCGSRRRPPQAHLIVIEHGAFADASGWDGVAGRLRRAGYPVIAPANPLRGVGSDANYLKSVLATTSTPVVLVGHSYGGMVITNAAVDAPNVKSAGLRRGHRDRRRRESTGHLHSGSRVRILGPSTTLERPFPGRRRPVHPP